MSVKLDTINYVKSLKLNRRYEIEWKHVDIKNKHIIKKFIILN